MNVKFSFDEKNVKVGLKNQFIIKNEIDNPIVKVSLPQGGGTTNYNYLQNKPKINNVELVDNKSLEDLGIQNSEALSNLEIEEILNNFV